MFCVIVDPSTRWAEALCAAFVEGSDGVRTLELWTYLCLGVCTGFFLTVPHFFFLPFPTCLHVFWDLTCGVVTETSRQQSDHGLRTVACNPNPVNSHSCSLAHIRR